MASMVVLVLLLAAASCCLAEVAEIHFCDEAPPCTVTEVRIDPCHKKNHGCQVKKGEDAALSFNFTPNFEASKLVAQASYNGVLFPGLDSDACKYTSCPVKPNQSSTYNYSMRLGKKLPTGPYLTTWKLINEDDPSQFCCFKTIIDLRKQIKS